MVDLTAKKHHDYPKVPFLTPGEWVAFNDNKKKDSIHSDTRQHGQQKDCSLPNKTLAYITDTEGVGVSGYQAHAIQDHARLVCMAIATTGCAPPTWSQEPITSIQYYHWEMCNTHPNLTLCEGDWKVHMLAINEYPCW
jgi:hypothetical protein